MWRYQSTHERGESEWLDEVLGRLARDPSLCARADATLRTSSALEPLIAESRTTPQSPPYHAEGPTLEYHLRLILIALYGLWEEAWHLTDIEEFRAMKGYEGELEELEETIKENAASFEVFALCHDAAKRVLVQVRPQPGGETEIGYPGHDRAIHTPVYRQLLQRVGCAHRLTDDDINRLEDIISLHLQPLTDFQGRRPERLRKYFAFAEHRGWDGDDFVDFLQAALFLDAVCGSKRRVDGRTRHDPLPLVNFLQSEHDYAPWRRAERERLREEKKKRVLNRRFRAVGLDGVALLELLAMEPGLAFGQLLRELHAGILGEGEMPAVAPSVAKELQRRVDAFYEMEFEKAGEGE